VPILLELLGVGRVKTLTAEWYQRDAQDRVLLADPVRLGCATFDKDFRKALRIAWEYARERFSQGSLVRWWLELAVDRESSRLGGDSIGLPLAAALEGLSKKMSFDRVGLTGAVDSRGNVHQVGGIPAKARAAYREGIRSLVLSRNDFGQFKDTLERAEDLKGLQVFLSETVSQALEEHLVRRVNDFLDFLDRLARAVLVENLQYLPSHLAGAKARTLHDFCLPPRVLDEKELEDANRSRHRDLRSNGRPAPYLYSSEELLKSEVVRRFRLASFDTLYPGSARKHCILRGEPGEGKTVTLALRVARGCLQLAEAIRQSQVSLASDDCLVPLFLALSTAAARSNPRLPDLLSLAMEETLRLAYGSEPPRLADWLRNKVRVRQFALHLDALDELPDHLHPDLGRQLEGLGDLPVLLTSRVTVADAHRRLVKPARFRLVPFGLEEVQEYVERYFAGHPQQAITARELERQLRRSSGPHLAMLPLVLALLCDRRATYPGEEFPATQTELLHLALHGMLERGDARRHSARRVQRDDAKEAVLAVVSWRFYARGPLPIRQATLVPLLAGELCRFKSDNPPQDLAPPVSGEALLNEFLQDGILVVLGPADYRFALRSFHEYCLAKWIAAEFPQLDPPADQSRGLRGWQNWFRRHPKPNPQDQFVKAIKDWQVWRGARKGWPDDDWDIPLSVTPYGDREWENVWPLVVGLLDRARSRWLLDHLFNEVPWKEEVRESNPDWVRLRQCIRESSERTREQMGEQATKLFENERNGLFARQGLAQFLGCVCGHDAEQALTKCLREESGSMSTSLRQTCAVALANYPSEWAHRVLAEQLANRRNPVSLRVTCAKTLAIRADSDALAALFSTARGCDDRDQVRLACVEALGQFHALAREALTELQDDAALSAEVRAAARSKLGVT